MEKVQLIRWRVIPGGFKGDDWARGSCRINEIQRCTEKTRQ